MSMDGQTKSSQTEEESSNSRSNSRHRSCQTKILIEVDSDMEGDDGSTHHNISINLVDGDFAEEVDNNEDSVVPMDKDAAMFPMTPITTTTTTTLTPYTFSPIVLRSRTQHERWSRRSSVSRSESNGTPARLQVICLDSDDE